MAGTSDLLREIADMLDAGFFKNITEEDLDRAKRVIMAFRDVKVDYEQAKRITGKSDSAFNAKSHDPESRFAKSGCTGTAIW